MGEAQVADIFDQARGQLAVAQNMARVIWGAHPTAQMDFIDAPRGI